MAIWLIVVILGVLFILFAASSAGLWAWLLVGAVGLAVCALLAVRVAKVHRHPVDRDEPVALRPSADDSVHRVLVIADDTCPPESLQAAIDEHANGQAIEAFVVAPALGSRLTDGPAISRVTTKRRSTSTGRCVRSRGSASRLVAGSARRPDPGGRRRPAGVPGRPTRPGSSCRRRSEMARGGRRRRSAGALPRPGHGDRRRAVVVGIGSPIPSTRPRAAPGSRTSPPEPAGSRAAPARGRRRRCRRACGRR